MDEYHRYDELYEDVLFKMLEEQYKKSYAEGWYIVGLVGLPETKYGSAKWIVKWDRDFMSKNLATPTKENPSQEKEN